MVLGDSQHCRRLSLSPIVHSIGFPMVGLFAIDESNKVTVSQH